MKRLYALSREDIAEIRVLCEIHAQRDVAALFRVHASTISRARRGLSWRSDGPAKRQSDLIPVRGDCFPWKPGELVLSVRKPTLEDVLATCWPVAGPSGRRK